jgi:DNA-directed RNA polymerase subunit L
MKISIPNNLKTLLDELEDAYLIYEWPLYSILGIEPKAIEIEVFKHYHTVVDILNLLGYKYNRFSNYRYEVIHPTLGNINLYVANIKISNLYRINRISAIKESAYIKDFTILSLMVDKEGTIYDFVKGLDSINNKILIPISNAIHNPIKVLTAARLAVEFKLTITKEVPWITSRYLHSFGTIISKDIWDEVFRVCEDIKDLNEYIAVLDKFRWKNTIFIWDDTSNIITTNNALFNMTTLIYKLSFKLVETKCIPTRIKRNIKALLMGVELLKYERDSYELNKLAIKLNRMCKDVTLKVLFEYLKATNSPNPNKCNHDYPVVPLITKEDLRGMGWTLIIATENIFLKQAITMQLDKSYTREQILKVFKDRLTQGHYTSSGSRILK